MSRANKISQQAFKHSEIDFLKVNRSMTLEVDVKWWVGVEQRLGIKIII